MNKCDLGLMGQLGYTRNEDYNKKVPEVNKLIDEHNSKINSFDTYEEQHEFFKQIMEKIKKLLYEQV